MTDIQAEELIESINQDMRHVMKDRKLIELNELRSLLARISSAEAVALPRSKIRIAGPVAGATEGVGNSEVSRRQLSFSELRAVILDEVNEINATLTAIDENSDYAVELRQKVAVIKKYVE